MKCNMQQLDPAAFYAYAYPDCINPEMEYNHSLYKRAKRNMAGCLGSVDEHLGAGGCAMWSYNWAEADNHFAVAMEFGPTTFFAKANRHLEEVQRRRMKRGAAPLQGPLLPIAGGTDPMGYEHSHESEEGRACREAISNIAYPSAEWIRANNTTSVATGFGDTTLWANRNVTHEAASNPDLSSRKSCLPALTSGCFSFFRTHPLPETYRKSGQGLPHAAVDPTYPPSGHRQTRGLSCTTNPVDPRHERVGSSPSAVASVVLSPTAHLL